MKIERFEDLEAWQEARKLVNMVYRIANNSPKFKKDYNLRGQVTDAVVSAMSNMTLAFAC